jgi:hypothetical protein
MKKGKGREEQNTVKRKITKKKKHNKPTQNRGDQKKKRKRGNTGTTTASLSSRFVSAQVDLVVQQKKEVQIPKYMDR